MTISKREILDRLETATSILTEISQATRSPEERAIKAAFLLGGLKAQLRADPEAAKPATPETAFFYARQMLDLNDPASADWLHAAGKALDAIRYKTYPAKDTP